VLLLANSASDAAQYYISPTGNDSHSGSFSQPWLTGQHAQGVVRPGDAVYFRAGTYTNPFSILTTAGTSNAPITFMAYPGEKPVWRVNGSSGLSPIVIDAGMDYYILDGLTITGGSECIRVMGANCIVQNCDLSGSWNSGLVVQYAGATNDIIRNCRVYNVSLMNFPRITHDWGGGISISRGANNCLVENCVAYLVHGEGILLANVNNGIVRNCICADTFKARYYADGINNLFEKNIGYSTPINDRLNSIVYGSPTSGAGFVVTTEGDDALGKTYNCMGLRGTRIINNLIVGGLNSCGIEVDKDGYSPTNYNFSQFFFVNNTFVNVGAEFSLISTAETNNFNPFGNNLHIANNLFLGVPISPYRIESIGPVTNTVDFGNNVHLFNNNTQMT
jgi:parallel beta-helix repeat protein